ncbi:E3 ubiquitin-protein ligase XIAP-like [Mytilus trossulus]|uniref:E3 ubiquitin-protein ligase XIAP-like n=1 Tax=Mytilus trossulus TaxID=6551 RepID=UPI003006CC17
MEYKHKWEGDSGKSQEHIRNLFSQDLCHTTAVATLQTFNYPLQEIMDAVKLYVTREGNRNFTAEDLLIIIRRSNSASYIHVETDGPDAHQSSVPDRDTDIIIEENRQIEESKLCKICLENKVNVVFLPCGHICACSDCSPAIRKCAICREFIKNVMKVDVI